MIAYFFTLLMCFSTSQATVPTVLHFEHIANGQLLERGKMISINANLNCSIKQWKYYISHVEILQQKGKSVLIPGVFLIDAFEKDSISFDLPMGEYAGIKFSIGIDSSIQLSGAQDGDLDPLNGMYWAWNTGYIHFKLEGDKVIMGEPANRFQYHIGGFAGAHKTMQEVKLDFTKMVATEKKDFNLPVIEVEAAVFFQNKKIGDAKPFVMKEGLDAVQISSVFPTIFSIKHTN